MLNMGDLVSFRTNSNSIGVIIHLREEPPIGTKATVTWIHHDVPATADYYLSDLVLIEKKKH